MAFGHRGPSARIHNLSLRCLVKLVFNIYYFYLNTSINYFCWTLLKTWILGGPDIFLFKLSWEQSHCKLSRCQIWPISAPTAIRLRERERSTKLFSSLKAFVFGPWKYRCKLSHILSWPTGQNNVTWCTNFYSNWNLLKVDQNSDWENGVGGGWTNWNSITCPSPSWLLNIADALFLTRSLWARQLMS